MLPSPCVKSSSSDNNPQHSRDLMARAITAWKKTKIIRIGGIPHRVWKIKTMPKLRILKNIAPPEMLLSKAKNAYADLMLRAGNMNTAGRQIKFVYPSEEFDKRLQVYEIYKNFLADRELSYTK